MSTVKKIVPVVHAYSANNCIMSITSFVFYKILNPIMKY